MASIEFDIKDDSNQRIKRTNDLNCKTTKKVIFTPSNSLGNRILGIVSGVIFSIMSNRIFELNWIVNTECQLSYDKLFRSLKENHIMKSFIPDKSILPYLPNIVTRNETTCDLDYERKDFLHFYFLSDKKLYEKINQNCHIIFMRYNDYFVNLVKYEMLDAKAQSIVSDFSKPFNQIANTIFRLKDKQISKATSFIANNFKGKKWISISIRAPYTSELKIKQIVNCADKLLLNNDISYVFFSSNDYLIKEKAYSYVSNGLLYRELKDKVYTESEDNYKNRHSNSSIEDTLLEWYLIGQADFCLASSIESSAMIKTSILRGRCKLIRFPLKGECSIENSVDDLEPYINSEHDSNIQNLPVLDELDEHQREQIWKTVNHRYNLYDEQCFESYIYQTDHPVHQYWTKSFN